MEDLDHTIKWSFIEYTKEGRSIFINNRQLRHFLKPLLDMKGSEQILDIGCGIGTLCKLVGPLLDTGKMIGIDLDPALVNYGNQHWARRPNFHLEVGDATNIAYPDGSFDLVVSMGLLPNVARPETVMDEVRRVLTRPGKFLEVHVDMANYVILPQEDIFERFYHDLIRGMAALGVDVQLTRFLAYCDAQDLPVEEFTFTMEYKVQITDKFIDLVETGMATYHRNDRLLQEVFDFNFQFLKHVGWTAADLWAFITREYSPEAHLAFLKAHRGAEYYRKLPIKIYRVMLPWVDG